MPALACLNGVFSSPEDARVPIWDRGFLFGDSVYEVCRLYQGRAWLEAEHWARLDRSLSAVRIRGVDLDALALRMRQTVLKSQIKEGIVYIQFTRGVAPRAHAFPQPPVPPTELIVVMPYDDGPTARRRIEGAAVISRPDLRWGRCDIKSTNLLPNVLACQEATEAGAIEAVLVDRDGYVTEATHSSLLWVRQGVVEASPEGTEILPGTTRQLLLRLIREEGLSFRETRIARSELAACEEVLLSGTTLELMPVVRVDGDPVGSGMPGPIARRLQTAFRRSVQRWLETGA
ncbi:MAG: aminotransferase [Isosphaeraceae bacterium]|jgi:D-alanine transaminase|nr:MAG: aminotransferase [Isosphaeraceae bacterium]